MITTQTSASLAQLSNSTGVVVAGRGNPKEPPTTRTNLSRERTDSGLDLETKNPLDLRSRENFFLDIPPQKQNSRLHRYRDLETEFGRLLLK